MSDARPDPLPAEAQDPRDAAYRRVFRRIAIERYERPLEVDVPERLARWRPAVALAGLVALLAAWAVVLFA